jgi:flagellar hook-basal body complex protein FliE
MSIAPIGAGVSPLPPITPSAPTQGTAATGKVDFAAGLEQVQKLTDQADQLGAQVATGKLENIHDFMAASAKANMAIELTAALRNKAVDAYQEIMRMQV